VKGDLVGHRSFVDANAFDDAHDAVTTALCATQRFQHNYPCAMANTVP